jgi:hypothetical protein
MSVEFIPIMGSDGGMHRIFEHDVVRHVAGDAETVRARLSDALELMGYRVLNDSPIQARRGARRWANAECAADILDYPTTLNVAVKSVGTNSTRVTFDYQVKGAHAGWFSKSDRKTLTSETEAILATALALNAATHCSMCGNETDGTSRFCRKCGSPLNIKVPAEVEVLRLTSKANASAKTIGTGLFTMLLAALLLLPLLLTGSNPEKFAKALKIFPVISGTFSLTGLLMILLGYWRLRKTILNPPQQQTLPTQRQNVIEFAAPDTNELPPASIQHPVTEATTDLLHHEIKRAS